MDDPEKRQRHRIAGTQLTAGAVLLLAACFAFAEPARGDDSLVLTRAEVPGYAAAGSGSKVARAALGGSFARSLRGAAVRGAAFRAGDRRVWVGVYTTASARRATRALRELSARARRVRGIGDAAVLRVRTTRRRTDATVVFRTGRAVAAVTFRVPGRAAAMASAGARAYAGTLAARVRRVLSLTAWDRNLSGIAPDGSITPQLALRAFAITFGPLPGVRLPRGPLGGPDSGTIAVGLVARVWDRLTRDQQAAIDRVLGVRHDAGSPPLARAADVAGGTLTEDSGLEQQATKWITYFKARMAGLVPVVKVYKTSEEIQSEKTGKNILGATVPVNAAGEWGSFPPETCAVRITPAGMAYAGTKAFDYILAHEVFHCFEYNMVDSWDREEWLMEGLADWAAIQASGFQTSHYKRYLNTPETPLFERDYDASGFWGHAEDFGGINSLWAKIPPILAQPNRDVEYALAGGTNPGFIGSWASAAWRMNAAGSAWRQYSPSLVSSSELPMAGPVVTGDAPLIALPYALSEYHVLANPTRPLVQVIVGSKGYLRAGTDGEDFGLVNGLPDNIGWFCSTGKCECPPNTEVSNIPSHRDVGAPELALALTGGPSAAGGHVAYHSLDEFCHGTQKPVPPDGPAETNGDPHLTTLDGLHFDFQAAGEFILARSRSGDLQIQARQQPYRDSRRVTVNTQLAIGIAGHRVTVSPGTVSDDYRPVVRIDGAVSALPAGARQAVGAGTVERDALDEDVQVTWPDGSRIVVRPVGPWGVAARIALADARRGTVSGLLGDFDGRPGDDLANRSGRRIAYHATPSDDWGFLKRYVVAEEFKPGFFDALYDDVGNAWRISQRESLFDYGPGQSTRTFTDRAIPTRPVDPDHVSGRERAIGICRARGVTEPGPLADCTVDLAATGNAIFAADALAAQEAALVDWTPLRAGAGLNSTMNLLEAADGRLHIGFESTGGTGSQALDVPLSAAGEEGPADPIAGVATEPWLLSAPDGGLRALATQTATPAGIYQYARGAGGWSGLGPVTTGGTSWVGRPSGLFLPDGTLFTVSPMSGVARVFHGAAADNPGASPTAALPGCYATSPALARDGATGALWVAWVQWNCAQVGVFVQQVDPATGALLGGPVKAPGSSWGPPGQPRTNVIGLDQRLALAGRPGQAGVYLAYITDDGSRMRLWRVGDSQARTISGRHSAGDAMLAAEPAGGWMWIAWTERGRLMVERTTPAGIPDGGLRAIPAPLADAPGPGLRRWAIAARTGALDVVYGRAFTSGRPGGLWHARLGP